MPTKKDILRKRRHAKIRSKIKGTASRPRLVINKSLMYTYAQLIDDENSKILASSSDMKAKGKGTKTEKAKNIGMEIAKKALDKKIKSIVFDRNGYKYHGRAKAVAEGAREGGLAF
jgi:large subunit ribosomal protein L18